MTLTEFHTALYSKVNTVYGIFQHFFSEECTDLQDVLFEELLLGMLEEHRVNIENPEDLSISEEVMQAVRDRVNNTQVPSMMVYWPEVTVTNEYNKSIVIHKLFAKIAINLDGMIPFESHGFLLNRSQYTPMQFSNGYIHSHVQSIDIQNLGKFRNPCLGTGPIVRTIVTLKSSFDEVQWMLFCQELSVYVTVESIAGVPYKHLEYITIGNRDADYQDYAVGCPASAAYSLEAYNIDSTEFLNYYLQHSSLSFNYIDGMYIPALSFSDFVLDISSHFIHYFNHFIHDEHRKNRMLDDGLLCQRSYDGNYFYTTRYSANNIVNYEGNFLFYFKEQPVLLERKREGVDNIVFFTLLHYRVATRLMNNILTVLNYNFKNGNTTSNISFTTGQNVYYV